MILRLAAVFACVVALGGGPLSAAPKAAPKPAAAQPATIKPAADDVPDHMLERWVVILGAYKTFAEAKADAQKFAKASQVPFSMNGRIFDKKGLRFPDNLEDDAWAGEYLARRDNLSQEGKRELKEYISVERSDGYEHFAKNLYIVVGAIAESKKEGLAQNARFKPAAPETYVKKTRIYMGCLH